MTDQTMKEQLIDLFHRLDRDDNSAMSALIDVTASHLNGIAYGILSEDAQSSRVIECLYSNIFERRGRERPIQTADPLNALRAIAHRYALHVKHFGFDDLEKDDLLELYVSQAGLSVETGTLSTSTVTILKSTYLDNSGTQSQTVKSENKEKLNEIVSNMMRGKS